MKNTFSVLISTLIACSSSQAATLLAVDFGNAGAESGFVQQSTTSQTHTTGSGDLNIAISDQQGLFNFATSGTNDDLYRDFYFKNGGTGGGTNGIMPMVLSGPAISPNTDYDLTFWSYYGAEGRNTTFTPSAGTTGPTLGPIALSNSPAPSSLNDPLYSISGTYTSDGTGALTILVGSTNNRPVINAVQIDTITAIPEPTTSALFGLGIIAFILRRKK